MRVSPVTRWSTIAVILMLAACAGGPQVRVDADPAVELTSYRTFGFFEPLATDQAGYSTLLTARLKDVTRREMEARGYVFEASAPQLRINFNVNVVEKTELRSSPSMSVGYGYYDYRSGLYGAWMGYPYDLETTNYRQGTLIIDLVDADRRALVWQGVAEGRISRKAMDDPAAVVNVAVSQIMARLPARSN